MIRYEINFDDIDIEEYEEFFEEVRDYLGDSVIRSSLDEKFIQGEIEEFTDDYLNFSLKDRIGITVILGVILSAFFLPEAFSKGKSLPKENSSDTTWIASMMKLEQKETLELIDTLDYLVNSLDKWNKKLYKKQLLQIVVS